jgi:hypothetical protein
MRDRARSDDPGRDAKRSCGARHGSRTAFGIAAGRGLSLRHKQDGRARLATRGLAGPGISSALRKTHPAPVQACQFFQHGLLAACRKHHLAHSRPDAGPHKSHLDQFRADRGSVSDGPVGWERGRKLSRFGVAPTLGRAQCHVVRKPLCQVVDYGADRRQLAPPMRHEDRRCCSACPPIRHEPNELAVFDIGPAQPMR